MAQRKSHMAQSLDLLQRLVQMLCHEIVLLRLAQVSQLPFHMAQSQLAARLILTTTSIPVGLDGMPITADGLYCCLLFL